LNKKNGLLVIVISSIILIPAFVIYWFPPVDENVNPQPLIEWDAEWQIQIGETFDYLVIIKDSNEEFGYAPIPYKDLEYSELNGTTIRVEITLLPELPTKVNSTILIDSLLKITKTDIRFANGSALPVSFVSFLNGAFSLSFLPTGVWDAIESILPRIYDPTYTGDPYQSVYFARTYDSYNIGHYSWAIDSGGVSEGNVTHTTGIPFMVYRHWDSQSDPIPKIFVVAHLL